MEVDGMEYVPMSWLGSGKLTKEVFGNRLDIPELKEREAALLEAHARAKAQDD
jgi:hypothetical protein